MNIYEMTKEQLVEESMIDIAYELLKSKGEHFTLQQLIDEIRQLNGMSVREANDNLPQLNTDINIDGRFLALDDTKWGLREWYPVDQLEAESAPVVRARRKKKAVKEDDEEYEEEYEDVDEDGFDIIDDEVDEDDDTEEVVIKEDDDEDLEDVDLLDDEEEIPEDIVLDDEDELEDEEEEY